LCLRRHANLANLLFDSGKSTPSAIKATTLVVVGGADMAGPSDVVLQAIPNATGLTLDGADHFDIPSSTQAIDAVETFINADR